ncbi:hypothetical protein V493_08650 [Pseudogymnoascus sp. VKM F-4281 (FW-2241)]|nr:hypothetical protein V493_08650 [Pseudogymnoascus sp. VKM F-4281 (FW-2241)]
MAVLPASSPTGTVPLVSKVELADFYTKHYSGYAKDYFATTFLAEGLAEEEDDNLGYYDDGVKRTLTDEQIAMFRHSEIETLLREKRKNDEAKADKAERASDQEREMRENPESRDASLTGIQTSKAPLTQLDAGQSSQSISTTGDQKKKNKSHFKRNIKPDLRKRTWDQVDHGLETLDYEEDVARPSPKRNAGPQRRTISYDDM